MKKVSRETTAWAVFIIACMSWFAGIGTAAADSYRAPEGCPSAPLTVEQDLARRRPNEAPYPVCVDQHAVFAEARDRARQQGRLLLVQFGAPWCPVCRSLPAVLAGLKTTPADRATAETMSDLVEVSITVSVVAAGKRQDIAAAQAIYAELAVRPGVEPMRAIPYLVVMAPDGGRTVGRNLDDLHAGGEGAIDRGQLARALVQARSHVRDGTQAPVSPSWMARRLRKLGL